MEYIKKKHCGLVKSYHWQNGCEGILHVSVFEVLLHLRLLGNANHFGHSFYEF